MKLVTAKSSGLVACNVCHKLHPVPLLRSHETARCNRCGARLHSRYPDSLNRTWALLIASTILYIPAITLPVMSVVMLGKGTPDTIISGVIHLIQGGMWPLALIVFVASVVVPVLKLLILTALLVSIQLHCHWRPHDRTRLYRITEFVGRWSMVDVFVIALLVALVQFGSLAEVMPGTGALSFAAVVVLTMLAARAFDPRLIWDTLEAPS